MVMVGRGLLLPPRVLLVTQPSQIQYLFNFWRLQHHIILMMKHSEWWLHSQCPNCPSGLSLRWQRLLGRCCKKFHTIWCMHLLWRYLHHLHFLGYFHFVKIFLFLYLIIHYLPYWLWILHRHSFVHLGKCLWPGHIKQVRKLIVMEENCLRTIILLKKH